MAKIATSKKSSTASANLQDEIAKVAYQLYVERGCQHGHDAEDWYRAEQIVKQKRVSRN